MFDQVELTKDELLLLHKLVLEHNVLDPILLKLDVVLKSLDDSELCYLFIKKQLSCS